MSKKITEKCDLCGGPMPSSFRVIDDDGNKKLICAECFGNAMADKFPTQEKKYIVEECAKEEVIETPKIMRKKPSKSTWYKDIDDLIQSTNKL